MEGAERPKDSTERVEYQGGLLDPRIQTELEKLNKASEDINRLELELDEARASFRQVLSESTQKLNALTKKLGTCIEKARPYYESRMKAKEAQVDTQNAALRFERACGQLAAAKEMVFLAEQGFFKKGQPFDPAWQEMLNHATMKVNDAEQERLESEVDHKRTARIFSDAEQTVKYLQKDLKRNISKSRPYFEMKAKFNHHMEDQKKRVGDLEGHVQLSKKAYKEALRNLEAISDSIHQQRREARLRQEMGVRGSGVGAEAPSPPPHSESGSSSSGGSTSTPPGGNDPEPGQCNTTATTCTTTTTSSDRSQNGVAGRGESFTHPLADVCAQVEVISIQSQKRPEKLVVNGGVCSDNTSGESDVPKINSVSDNSKLPPPGGDSVMETETGKGADDGGGDGGGDVEEDTQGGTDRQQARRVSGERVLMRPARSIIPTVELSTPGSNIPTSPGGSGGLLLSPGVLTSPDSESDLEQTRTNAEIMDSLQREKGLIHRPFLRANRRSQDDLLSEASDSESMTGSIASAHMLDDEQIESLMHETGEYNRFLSKMDGHEVAKWKRMSLPTKLGYLEEHLDFKPVWIDIDMSLESPPAGKVMESGLKDILKANEAPPNPKELRESLVADEKIMAVENKLQEVSHHPLLN